MCAPGFGQLCCLWSEAHPRWWRCGLYACRLTPTGLQQDILNCRAKAVEVNRTYLLCLLVCGGVEWGAHTCQPLADQCMCAAHGHRHSHWQHQTASWTWDGLLSPSYGVTGASDALSGRYSSSQFVRGRIGQEFFLGTGGFLGRKFLMATARSAGATL